jgi:hypothetical protein
VVQPFREAGARIVFYRVDDHLQIDQDDLQARLSPDVLAVLVIHYFGFFQPQAALDLVGSADPQIFVIEDCTHAWLSQRNENREAGHPAIATVISPRKFFPIPDAALVLPAMEDMRPSASIASPDWHYTLERTIGLFLRWVFAQSGAQQANRLAFSLLHRAERSLDTDASVHSASWISKRILSNLDCGSAARQRRTNFEILRSGIVERSLPLVPLHEHLAEGVTPLGFPVVSRDRDSLKALLIQKGIFPPIHWLLPDDPALHSFHHLVELSHHILTVPLDQRYGTREMTYVLDCLTEWASSQ